MVALDLYVCIMQVICQQVPYFFIFVEPTDSTESSNARNRTSYGKI